MKQKKKLVFHVQKIRNFFFILLTMGWMTHAADAATTSTTQIWYYFGLEQSTGGTPAPEPDPEPKPCSLTCPNGELDEVNCLCICPYGTGKNGACCPNPGKDAARCLTALQLDGNGCDTYVSACSDGKVCDGAGQCVCTGVCDLENYAWDEACACQCILDANACTSGISYFVNDAAGCRCAACPDGKIGLTCPVADGTDANGCPQYREKTQADCPAGEVLEGCDCVQPSVSCTGNYVLVDGACVCGLVCEGDMVADETCSSCICENGGQWARVDAYQPAQYTYTCCPSDRVVSENGELICCKATYTENGVKKCLRDTCPVLDNYGDEVGSFPCDGICIYDGDLTFFCCPQGTDTAQGHC